MRAAWREFGKTAAVANGLDDDRPPIAVVRHHSETRIDAAVYRRRRAINGISVSAGKPEKLCRQVGQIDVNKRYAGRFSDAAVIEQPPTQARAPQSAQHAMQDVILSSSKVRVAVYIDIKHRVAA